MKKYIFIALAALAIFSCSKEETVVPQNETTSLDFVFKVSDKPSFGPETKGPKTSWTDGDWIFIVLDDVLPQDADDFLILEYKASENDWVVVNEGKATPNAAGGTLDALYYENPSPELLYVTGTEGQERIIFEQDESKYGQYFYLNQNNVPYTVEGGKVEASISLDFQENSIRTYTQFRVTGIEGEWKMNVNNSAVTYEFIPEAPAWQNLNKSFQYNTVIKEYATLKSYPDGQYAYFSVFQKSDDVTITLIKDSGENAGIYQKTFTKKISGRSAAITFQGPQFDENGVPTNGWKSAFDFNNYDDIHEGHPYVEMGEGIFWATGNVGAEDPSTSGDYFAWGEVSPYYASLSPLYFKAMYSEGYWFDSYKFYEMSTVTVDGDEIDVLKVTKYNDEDGLTVLEPDDDAASKNWGGKWRTPTQEEWKWLNDNCTWESFGSVIKATSTVEGYEGKYILFPLTRYFYQTDLANGQYYYYTATKPDGEGQYQQQAYCAILRSTGCSVTSRAPRFYGLPIRPIYTTE